MRSRAALAAIVLALAAAVAPVAQDRAVAGTGRIEGRVELTGGGTVRRATVTLSGDLPRNQTTITDDEGAFRFDNLPAGGFTVTAERPGFITSSYGASAPGRPGTRVSVAAGQQVANVVIRIARGAVIAGTVRDERGDPVPGARVAALSLGPMDARAIALLNVGLVPDPTTFALTDERGAYRIWGLRAGSYLLAVSPQQYTSEVIESMTPAEMDARFARAQNLLLGPAGVLARTSDPSRSAAGTMAGADPPRSYTPVFYPGTPSAANAQPITVDFGDERPGVDVVFAPTRSMVVAGTVRSAGSPWPRVQLILASDAPVHLPWQVQRHPALVFDQSAPTATSVDFRFTGVVPDRYMVIARSAAGSPPFWASAEVDVSAGDITGVELALRPPIRLRGRVRFEGTAAAPSDLSRLRVALGRVTDGIPNGIGFRPAMFQTLPAGTTALDAGGGFTLPAVHPGVFMISAGVPGATPWRLQSAMLGNRDLLDDPLVVPPDRRDDITGVVLTFGDRRTTVAGTLQTTSGMPAPEYFIVVFTTERRWWRPDGRRLAFARPATDGQFVIGDLPPGRYYIAALTDLDAAGWQTPEFLDRVVPGALSFDLTPGETHRQDLQIAGAR